MTQQPPGGPPQGPEHQGHAPQYPLGPPPPGPQQPPGPWNLNSPWQQGPTFDGPRLQEPQVRGRSPRQPFGDPPPRPVHIESFSPPKQKWPLWVGIGSAVLVVLVIVFTIVFPLGPAPTSTPTHTTRTASTPQANVIEFKAESGTAEGRWEILRSDWGTGYVDVEMKIQLTSGDLRFSFYAFGNTQARGVESITTDKSPDISTGSLSQGETVQGWVRFPLSQREQGTAILATRTGRQIAAGPIKG